MLQTQKPCKPNCIFSFYLNDSTNWIAYFAQAWIFFIYSVRINDLNFAIQIRIFASYFGYKTYDQNWERWRERKWKCVTRLPCFYFCWKRWDETTLSSHMSNFFVLFILSYKNRIVRKKECSKTELTTSLNCNWESNNCSNVVPSYHCYMPHWMDWFWQHGLPAQT